MYYKPEIPKAYQGIIEDLANLVYDKDQFVIHDLFHLEKNNGVGFWQRYAENNWLKKGIKNSREIMVFSDNTKNQLESFFPLAVGKIKFIKPLVDDRIQPLDDDAKDAVRYHVAEGNAYFLYDGPVHPAANLIELLKGFSIFKKKIGSNMKLVLSGIQGKYSESFLQSLETYKFRTEVILTGNLSFEKRIELLSSAYALIHSCKWERFGMPVPLAMRAGVAVLVPDHSVHSEMAGMAGMFFNEKDPADIGEKIIRIYRDEQIRTEMIGTGLQRIKNWE
jgi:glycosyltransferase involved in cell wall biosynthesis